MMPGPGRHFVPYKNKWFWVERERQVNSVTLETGQPWEKVILLLYIL
jgi:BCS1 N terminal